MDGQNLYADNKKDRGYDFDPEEAASCSKKPAFEEPAETLRRWCSEGNVAAEALAIECDTGTIDAELIVIREPWQM